MTVFESGVRDLYDSERKAVHDIAYGLRIKHSFRGVKTIDQEDAIKRAFEVEARNRCGDLGLVTEVWWEWTKFKDGSTEPRGLSPIDDLDKVKEYSPTVSEREGDHNLYWNPLVVIVGRTDKLSEYDHERQQFEIRRGVLDGVEGVINPDTGKLSEPKKKNIY
jgi:hypothetical protein